MLDSRRHNAPLRVTNDADFQSCTVADGVLTVTRRESSRNGERRMSRYFPLDHFPSVLDMLRLDWAGPDCEDES